MNCENLTSVDAITTPTVTTAPPAFVDRRVQQRPSDEVGRERRQFANGYGELSPEARELGEAIDRYKMQHRRRLIGYEEILTIVRQLGYERPTTKAE